MFFIVGLIVKPVFAWVFCKTMDVSPLLKDTQTSLAATRFVQPFPCRFLCGQRELTCPMPKQKAPSLIARQCLLPVFIANELLMLLQMDAHPGLYKATRTHFCFRSECARTKILRSFENVC